MTLPQHLSKSAERYTPEEVCDAIRRLFEEYFIVNSDQRRSPLSILDPASCDLANTLVKATDYYTVEQDGLDQVWNADAVFLNPPGGKDEKNKSRQQVWSAEFCRQFKHGHFDIGAFICFNPNILFTAPELTESATVFIFRKRWQFLSEYLNGELRPGQWSESRHGDPVWRSQPTHHSAVVIKHTMPLPLEVFKDLDHYALRRTY